MVLRYVPGRVINGTARLWISVSERLKRLFTSIPDNIVGAPHLVVKPFRLQVEAILASGVIQYLGFVEQNERSSLSLVWRPTEFSLGRDKSVEVVGSSLYAETNTEVGDRLVNTLIGLGDLIWAVRSLLKKEGVVSRPLRKYFFAELTVIERCWRDLAASEFIQFMPNARTSKRIPEPVLRALAENLHAELRLIDVYIGEVKKDPFALDMLVGLKHLSSTLLRGLRPGRLLTVSDIMDRLASPHARHLRGARASIFELVSEMIDMEVQGRLTFYRGGGTPQLSDAVGVVGVHARKLVLPWGLSIPESN